MNRQVSFATLVAAVVIASFLGGLVATRLTSTAQADAKPGTVVANNFELRDASGRLVMQMAPSLEGPPGMFFYDAKGRVRLVMGLYEDGQPYVGLNDSNNQIAGLFRLHGNDQPVLVLKNNGQDRGILGLNDSAAPYMWTSERMEFGTR